MKNFPVPVPDTNKDRKLSYNEVEVSIHTVAANITNTTVKVMIRPQALLRYPSHMW